MAAPSITGRHDSDPSRFSDPAVGGSNIDAEKSDTVDLTSGPTRGIICDVAGLIKFNYISGDLDTITVLAGVVYPFAIKRLWSGTTTATGVHALR